jgi:ATP-dependent Clp protease ATP-binding subunit ClpC
VLERFDDQARVVVDRAYDEAVLLGHEQVGTEHLLLGLLAEGGSNAARALMSCGANLDGCRAKATEAVASKRRGTPSQELMLTDRAARSLERAGRLSLRQRRDHVDPTHVLLSVLDVEGTAGQVLRGLGVDLACIREALNSVGEAAVMPGPPDPSDAPPPTSIPVCPKCESSLDDVLAHRVVTSRGDDGKTAQWTVAYCSSCGTTMAGHRGAK